MEFIKENKKTLLICFGLISISLLIAYFVRKNESLDDLDTREYLKKYEVNEIVPINMNEEQMARKYLTEYVKLIKNNPKKAYELLNTDYREIRFPTINDFINHFSVLISDQFLSAKVTGLKVTNKISYKQFYIVDASGNVFIFNEHSIMNYDVMLDVVTI